MADIASAAERSTESPIASLPIEIFVEILRWRIALSWRGHDPTIDHRAYREPYTWIIATHVCRSWRTAALRTPDLWTTISAVRPIGVHTFLKRSQGRPLCVYMSSRSASRYPWACWPLLLRELHRVRSFILHANCDNLAEPSYPWARVAACIETMDIDTSRIQKFPLINEELPLLTVLRLYVGPVVFTSFLCPCLKVLDYEAHSGTGGPWTEWLRVLRGLPLLEELALRNSVTPSLERTSYSGISPVNLPHLQRICLFIEESNGPEAPLNNPPIPGEILLFRLLCFPQHTAMDIRAQSPKGVLQLAEAVETRLTAHAPSSAHPGWSNAEHTVMSFGCTPGNIDFFAWDSASQPRQRSRLRNRRTYGYSHPLACRDLSFEPIPSVRLEFCFADAGHWAVPLYQRIPRVLCTVYPLHDLRTFALDHRVGEGLASYDPGLVHSLKGYTEKMTNVQTLYLCGAGNGHIVEEFVEHILLGAPTASDADIEEAPTSSDPATPFPSLEYLCIGFRRPNAELGLPSKDRLELILRKRGVAIHAIKVHFCTMPELHWFCGPPTKETATCGGEFFTVCTKE